MLSLHLRLITFFLFLAPIALSSLSTSLDQETRVPAPDLQSIEILRRTYPNGSVIAIYQLSAANFPKGKSFTLKVSYIDGSEEEIMTYQADRDGFLISDHGNLEDDLFSIEWVVPGEPIIFSFISQDGKNSYTLKIIANPIETTAADGAYFWIERANAEGTLFIGYAQGISSHEKVQVKWRAGENSSVYTLKPNHEGSLNWKMSLESFKEKQGICQLEIAYRQELLKLMFPWGKLF